MSTILQITGLATIAAGVLILSIPVGLVAAGAFLVLIGYSIGK